MTWGWNILEKKCCSVTREVLHRSQSYPPFTPSVCQGFIVGLRMDIASSAPKLFIPHCSHFGEKQIRLKLGSHFQITVAQLELITYRQCVLISVRVAQCFSEPCHSGNQIPSILLPPLKLPLSLRALVPRTILVSRRQRWHHGSEMCPGTIKKPVTSCQIKTATPVCQTAKHTHTHHLLSLRNRYNTSVICASCTTGIHIESSSCFSLQFRVVPQIHVIDTTTFLFWQTQYSPVWIFRALNQWRCSLSDGDYYET